MLPPRRILSSAALLLLALPATAQQSSPAPLPDQPVAKEQLAPGAFKAFTAPFEARVLPRALQARPSPASSWGTSINHFFHSNIYNHNHGGFEPMAIRPKYRVVATAPDSVELDQKLAQNFREGFFDGARVRVYQPIDGKLELIRDTEVKPGGHHATGWLPTREQITTTKDKTRFTIALDSSFLPDREYWFCVKAVDKFMQFSAPSNAVSERTGEAKGQASPEPYAPRPRFDLGAVDKPAPPPAPKNLRATREGENVTFEWDAVDSADLVGYKLFVSSAPPEEQKGFRLELADRGPRPDRPVQRGDIVFVDHPGLTTFTQDILSPYIDWPAKRQVVQPFDSWMLGNHRFWSDGSDYAAKWELVPHPEPLPAEFAARGRTCLKWEVGGDELTGFMLAPTGGAGRDNLYYTPLEPGEYVVEAWMRGSGKAGIAFTGPHANPGTPLPFNQRVPAENPHAIAPVELPVPAQWEKVTGTFTVGSVPEGGLGHILFTYQGPGTLYLDDLRIYRKDAAPYGVLQEVYLGSLKDSGARFTRTHELIRTKFGYTLDENTLPAGGSATSMSGWRQRPTTFLSLLETARQAGTSPRLQVEMCLSDDEWRGLAEWLLAPYDPAKGDTPAQKPWAHRRWALGQQKPWIEEFPEFALEISNETWNQTFAPYDWDWGQNRFDGADGRAYSYGDAYGLFQQHVIDLFKSSPYWNDEIAKKFHFPLGGWTVALEFGADAARRSPGSTAIGYANYLGTGGLGDPKVMNDFKRFYMMQWALSGVEGPTRKAMEKERQLRAEGVDVTSEIYEYGILYTAGGQNSDINAAENLFGRSIPGAVAILDGTLKALSLGFQDLFYFTFAPTPGTWGTNAPERFGGFFHPMAKALSLYNHYGKGQMLEVEVDSAPTWNFPAYEALDNTTVVKRAALPDAPLISAYASALDNRVTLFLLSRKIDNFPVAGDDGFTPATVKLPFSKAGKITLHKLTGDPRASDLLDEHAKIETVELSPAGFHGVLTVNAATGGDTRGLPPASIFCYVFEGTDIGKIDLPPVARFQVPDSIVAGEPAQLQSTSGSGLAHAWDFGPGGTSAEQNPTVTFPEAVLADLRLTVTTPEGLSDTITWPFYPIGVRFGGELWHPWRLEAHMRERSAVGSLGGDGSLTVRGVFPAVSSGFCSILRGAPRADREFTFEATVAGVEGEGADPRLLGGLALAVNERTGLGFGNLDFESLALPASILLSPDGAVRKLKGQGDALDELLPPGSVSFPAKLRLAVKGEKATAAIEQADGWKDLATFDLPADIGLMPAFIAASAPRAKPTTLTVKAASIK